MAQGKENIRFAEVERLLDEYFSSVIAPIMKVTKNQLAERQVEEMKEYSTSAAGILSMLTASATPFVDPYQNLKYTGEWNSKTTEDYIEMCRDRVSNSEEIQKDFAIISSEWRNVVIEHIGRERYDDLSEKIGCDLSYAYIDYRLQQQMIEKLVKDKMPKSSADYIIRKASQSSLFGLANELQKSQLDLEIEKRGEKAYNPSSLEKGTATTIGAVVDTVSLGGIGSWGTFAKLVGTDVVLTTVANQLESKDQDHISVEDCISKGVFGSDDNVFVIFRKEAQGIELKTNDFINNINDLLNKKIVINHFSYNWQNNYSFNLSYHTDEPQSEDKYKDIPKVIAPGHEESYLKSIEKTSEPITTNCMETEETVHKVEESEETSDIHLDNDTNSPTNEKGWNILPSLGLDGFGDITHNLGYVISMLPDMMVGLFTGKTKSLNMDNSLLPVASILCGMFVRNPLLKMLLVGFGGLNLLNKVGHEVIENKKGSAIECNTGTRYKHYADEPLNSRIVNPVLQGSNLIATIDNVPYSIQLPSSVVDAYKSGALPLNTLANAILVKNDQMQRMASTNYSQNEQETITRTRGIQ